MGSTNRLKTFFGPTSVLVTLFVLSAAFRLTESAFAQSTAGDQREIAPAPVPTTCETDEDLSRLLTALLEREGQVVSEEARIEEALANLAAQQEKLAEQQAELAATKSALENTMSTADAASENDLAKLTAVYERMKPKKAAALFEAMRPEFAAGFLGRMKPDNAAGIMAAMTPEQAYSISAIIAGRNANAGQLGPASN